MPNLECKMVNVYMAMSDEIRKVLPDSVREIKTASIDLDFTGLSIADIFRNLNSVYPPISRERGLIKAGKMVICVIVKSEYLAPYKGIVFMITDDKIELNAFSKKYLVFAINEKSISDEDDILNMITRLTKYLVRYSRNEILKLQDFFVKFVYDPGEEKRENALLAES